MKLRFISASSLHRLFLSLILLISLTCGAVPAWATGVYQMPELTAGDRTWVFDLEEVLSRSTESRMTKTLSELADESVYQVRFVTVRRLDYGETAQSFADQLFEKWFPTPDAGENQIVLVVDTQTNNSAIHAGEATQPLLSNEIAQSVVDETLPFYLKDGKYNEGFLATSDRLSAILSGQSDPGAPKFEERIQVESTFKSAEETDDQSATIIVVVLLVIATVVPMATYYYFQRS
ncbi:MAG: YgcG family protein [Oscillatoriales cyanobacterium RM2_1_1]|nr:YgcG family protein [Oscillatoriales cyanobacterium SM2_3_0]NJO44800.1 YgcG family protein [Oscillatoriales cyanobacterium RM2_1_1]